MRQAGFCADALDLVIAKPGPTAITSTEKGSQFTEVLGISADRSGHTTLNGLSWQAPRQYLRQAVWAVT